MILICMGPCPSTLRCKARGWEYLSARPVAWWVHPPAPHTKSKPAGAKRDPTHTHTHRVYELTLRECWLKAKMFGKLM